MIGRKKNQFFKNIEGLRNQGISLEYTQEQIDELRKCRESPLYFINNFVKIRSLDHEDPIPFKTYDYQDRIVNTYHENQRSVVMMSRQQGKTSTTSAYILWAILFHAKYNVVILAYDLKSAVNVMTMIKGMYEEIPYWMQQGILKWSEKNIVLENGSTILANATTKSGVRGKSCVIGSTKVCVLDENGGIFYLQIGDLKTRMDSAPINSDKILYTVYKTTNSKNGKEYVGFHKSTENNILRMTSIGESCFKDGYLGSGKLLLRAIEAHLPESFNQEIIGVFENKEDAYALERELVNSDYVSRNDTYNIAIGGNVLSLFGEKNGFFGKKHSKETIQKIKETREKNNLPTYQTSFMDLVTGEKYFGYNSILDKFDYRGYSEKIRANGKYPNHRFFIAELIVNKRIEIENKELEVSLLKLYNDRLFKQTEEYLTPIKQKRLEHILKISRRERTPQQREKIKKSNIEWIKNNPELHRQRMEKINKNPDKIRKMANTHRGMKRSAEARLRMSLASKGKPSSTKGKKAFHDPVSKKCIFISPTDQIPSGFIAGTGNKKAKGKRLIHDLSTNEQKMFIGDVPPSGWGWGRGKKP